SGTKPSIRTLRYATCRLKPKNCNMKTDTQQSASVDEAKGQGMLASATGSVFEAVDASSDEQYYTVGIWMTLEVAIAAFRKLGDNEPGEDIGDGVKIIEIRERKLGELDWAET